MAALIPQPLTTPLTFTTLNVQNIPSHTLILHLVHPTCIPERQDVSIPVSGAGSSNAGSRWPRSSWDARRDPGAGWATSLRAHTRGSQVGPDSDVGCRRGLRSGTVAAARCVIREARRKGSSRLPEGHAGLDPVSWATSCDVVVESCGDEREVATSELAEIACEETWSSGAPTEGTAEEDLAVGVVLDWRAGYMAPE